MTLITGVIAGGYNASYAPKSASSFSYASLGTLTNDGVDEDEPQAGTELTSNVHGETVLDGITGGSQSMTLKFILQQANLASVRNLIRPFVLDSNAATAIVQNTSGTAAFEGAVQPAGMKWSEMAGRLCLTPITGLSADVGNSTAHIRYYKHVVLMNGNSLQRKYWYRERFVPIVLRVLPYLDTDGVFRFWEYVSAEPTSA